LWCCRKTNLNVVGNLRGFSLGFAVWIRTLTASHGHNPISEMFTINHTITQSHHHTITLTQFNTCNKLCRCWGSQVEEILIFGCTFRTNEIWICLLENLQDVQENKTHNLIQQYYKIILLSLWYDNYLIKSVFAESLDRVTNKSGCPSKNKTTYSFCLNDFPNTCFDSYLEEDSFESIKQFGGKTNL
jgi:hypothetical protein